MNGTPAKAPLRRAGRTVRSLVGLASLVLCPLIGANAFFGILLGGCFHSCRSSGTTVAAAIAVGLGSLVAGVTGWIVARRSWARWGLWLLAVVVASAGAGAVL